jgi:Domain of unknown function (DUF4129)
VVLGALLSELSTLPLKVPVDPNGPDAQQLLARELAKSEYLKAQPSPFDRLVSGLINWLNSLLSTQTNGPPSLAFLIVLGIIVAGIVIAVLVFGVPRVNRKSTVTGSLFGENDERSAGQMRTAAEGAAASGDYATAIAEMFRAIARGLAERTVLSIFPGTTAHDFSVRAGAVFPRFSAELTTAAASFDTVRYLGKPGTAHEYTAIATLERELRLAQAMLEAVPS